MLTRVGPGTPYGELMRRYWHPVAATAQLEGNPVRKVCILGEDLVLFRDRNGNLGLLESRCSHRAMNMAFGIPEEAGLRCPYHGWRFDGTGRCLEQPPAPPDSTFKDRVRIAAYQVQEMGGSSGPIWSQSPLPSCPGWTSASGITSYGRSRPPAALLISTKCPKLGGSTLRTMWTATALIESSFSSCTRRSTG